GEAEDERGRGRVEPERAPDGLGDVAGLVGDGAAGAGRPLVHDDGVGAVFVAAAEEADAGGALVAVAPPGEEGVGERLGAEAGGGGGAEEEEEQRAVNKRAHSSIRGWSNR